MDIPGLGTLYEILKRDIEHKNDALLQRQELSGSLENNCTTWATLLVTTFNQAVDRWAGPEGKAAAQKEIVLLQQDFLKLDYESVHRDSPILNFLRQDSRFIPFADACSSFYDEALNVKRIVYGRIEKSPNQYISLEDAGIISMVTAWNKLIEAMLFQVRTEYHRVRTFSTR